MIKLFYSEKTRKIYAVNPVFTNYTRLQPFFSSYNHTHPVYHLVFILQGVGSLELDTMTISLSEGDIILINPGEKHVFATQENELLYYAVNFLLVDGSHVVKGDGNYAGGPEVVKKYEINGTVEEEPLENIINISRENSYLLYDRSKWNNIKKDIEFFQHNLSGSKAVLYLKRYDNSYSKSYNSRVYDFIFNMYTKYLQLEVAEDKPPEEPLIISILSILEKNVNNKLDLQQLAEELNYNASYISRLFKEKMKITISEYFNIMKVEKALDYLRNSNKNITEIAYSLGYNSSQHFSRSFKEVKNITPSEYRNNCEYF